MSTPGSLRAAAPAAAVALLLLGSLAGCTKGEGAKCTNDTACDFGLACVFQDVAVVDCCAVDSSGKLTCDPTAGNVIARGIAPDCEYDAAGMLKPRLRRVTCLGAVFEEYVVWNGALEDGDPVLVPVGAEGAALSDDCRCEPGANFSNDDPARPYDPVLPASPEFPICARDPGDPEPDPSIEPPTVAPADCPQPNDADTCPPCVAFPEP